MPTSPTKRKASNVPILTQEVLSTIKVLWRAPDHLALYGIPYELRPGQSPRDLWRAYHEWEAPKPGHYGSKRISLDDWVYLGNPGWFGTMTRPEIQLVEEFLAAHKQEVPGNPYEWSRLNSEASSL